MKKIFFVAACVLLSAFSLHAQRYAYVDTEYILSNIPEYEEAQKQVEELSINWQKEIEDKFAEIDVLYKKFQNEAPLLTQEMKQRKENEIIQKEKQAKDLQKKRFGNDGDLFKKRQELVRPIQDKVFVAIEKRAQNKTYAFVFDRAQNANLLYADTRMDISNEVLEDMGYSIKEKKNIKVGVSGQQGSSTVDKNVKIGN